MLRESVNKIDGKIQYVDVEFGDRVRLAKTTELRINFVDDVIQQTATDELLWRAQSDIFQITTTQPAT